MWSRVLVLLGSAGRAVSDATMGHSSRTTLVELSLLSLIVTCLCDCRDQFDDEALNNQNQLYKQLISDGWYRCDEPMPVYNVNCTLTADIKPQLTSHLYKVSNGLSSRCNNQRLRVFIMKPHSGYLLPIFETDLEMDIIKHLHLDGLGIENIKPGVLKSLKILESIHLRENNLRTIGDNVFRNVVNLKELDLSDNRISNFTPGWSNGLDGLEILNLSQNQLMAIPLQTFHIFKNLRELNLSGNGLIMVETSQFKNLKNLTSLDLSKNNLYSFDFGTFDDLQNLTTLNISYNKFKVLPVYTFHSMGNLKNLYFTNNELRDLHINSLRQWKLKKVDFRENSFCCEVLLQLIDYLENKNIYFEQQVSTDGENVYGFKCQSLYSDYVSLERYTYIINDFSTRLQSLSDKYDKVLLKLNKLWDRINEMSKKL
ncbi:unnamed protein product [Acanthoscelides obtectus]|uniref:Uncharacterized protein n=1 Tax=Acanthoscelides obtectus TaxID=200917 RepID=A0A9P0JZ82_ACAOB|nr:unnamed protein product [Acanthoscelides obtectus]CAK1621832.1 Leucine-rich repeat-containing G-protein coupled receptor 5 [Acanthoscelides obtectus]